MKDLDSNVSVMKDWLINNIGADWATATTRNANSKLGIPTRGVLPWVEVTNQMNQVGRDSVQAHVARTVRDLTYTYYAFR